MFIVVINSFQIACKHKELVAKAEQEILNEITKPLSTPALNPTLDSIRLASPIPHVSSQPAKASPQATPKPSLRNHTKVTPVSKSRKAQTTPDSAGSPVYTISKNGRPVACESCKKSRVSETNGKVSDSDLTKTQRRCTHNGQADFPPARKRTNLLRGTQWEKPPPPLPSPPERHFSPYSTTKDDRSKSLESDATLSSLSSLDSQSMEDLEHGNPEVDQRVQMAKLALRNAESTISSSITLTSATVFPNPTSLTTIPAISGGSDPMLPTPSSTTDHELQGHSTDLLNDRNFLNLALKPTSSLQPDSQNDYSLSDEQSNEIIPNISSYTNPDNTISPSMVEKQTDVDLTTSVTNKSDEPVKNSLKRTREEDHNLGPSPKRSFIQPRDNLVTITTLPPMFCAQSPEPILAPSETIIESSLISPVIKQTRGEEEEISNAAEAVLDGIEAARQSPPARSKFEFIQAPAMPEH